VRTSSALYGATAQTYLQTIHAEGAGDRLMLVGHNPAMEDTARLLTGEGAEEAIARLLGGFKPGAVAVIDFDAASWSALRPKAGRLAEFLVPE